MDQNYDFNGPNLYYDLDNQVYDEDPDLFFATPIAQNSKIDDAVLYQEEEVMHDLATESIKDTPKKKTLGLHKSNLLELDENGLPHEFPIRHSPRLAAIAKAVRRSNANRGIVDSTLPKERNHRRSLSDGNIVSKLQKANTRKAPMKAIEDDSHLPSDHGPQHKKARPKRTVPVEFHFATDSRLKNKDTQDDLAESTTENFVRSLRSNSSDAISRGGPKGPTKVKPFKFQSQEKLPTAAANAKPFISIAELNMKYYTQTPARYRTKRSNSSDRELPPARKGKGKGGLTIPHTPQLTCRTRSRPVAHPTREEEEEQELAEVQKHKFKAKPVDKRIYDHSPVQVIDRKKTLAPVRQELPRDLKGSMMLSSASLQSLPHHGVPNLFTRRKTQIQAFSFDTRDAETKRKKEEKIQKQIEEEKRAAEFHANPMPIFEEGVAKGLPPKKPPTPTNLKPFTLQTDIRGAAREELFEKEQEEEAEYDAKLRAFHAQSDAVLFKAPFIPCKSKKPLTDISGFSLNTEKRSVDRHDFDLHLKQKEDEMQAKKKEFEDRKLKEEEAEVAKMRKEAVHHAKPVPHSKPFVVKRGLMPVTEPVSPEFLTNARLTHRTASNMQVNTTIDDFNPQKDKDEANLV